MDAENATYDEPAPAAAEEPSREGECRRCGKVRGGGGCR
jgi:hypothetical protein